MSRRLLRIAIVVFFLSFLFIVWGVNYIVNTSTAGQIYSDVNKIPKNKVGLLLGTAKYKDKARHMINSYYQNRIDAAVALYMAGKIDYIIVSGDSVLHYDEPAEMKADLVAKGVPADRIYMDNAGFRTLDSILRCRDIYGEDHITIISQQFHNQRALFISNHKHVTAVAFNAVDDNSVNDVALRERLARIKMVYDLVFNTQARYYGTPVTIK